MHKDEGLATFRAACGMRIPEPGRILCLSCSKHFNSSDRVRIRICNACKNSRGRQGTRDADCDYPAIAGFSRNFAPTHDGKLVPGLSKAGRAKRKKQFGNAPLAKRRNRS